jgi:hypothetical protein
MASMRQTYQQIAAQMYLTVEMRLRASLVEATRAGLAGQWSARRTEALLAQVGAELVRLNVWLDANEPQQLRLSFDTGQAIATQEVRAVAPELAAGTWDTLNRDAIEAIIADASGQRGLFFGITGGYPGAILRNAEDYLRALTTGEILAGIGAGDGPRTVGREIRDRGIEALREGQQLQEVAARMDRAAGVTYFRRDEAGNVLRDADGAPVEAGTRSLHSYGQMTARTGMANAQEAGTVDRYQAMGVELFTVSRHGTLCYLCRPMEEEGLVFRFEWATGEGARRYPLCPWPIPRHPACMHARIPYIAATMGDNPPTSRQRAALGLTDRELYARMRDKEPELQAAAKQGFAFEQDFERARKQSPRVDASELRGPRWRQAGIEGRRIEATRRMLEDPELPFTRAMSQVTGEMLRDTRRGMFALSSPPSMSSGSGDSSPTPKPVKLPKALASLPENAREFWKDASVRRQAVQEISDAYNAGDPARLSTAISRADDAVVQGLSALGYPRGPVNGVSVLEIPNRGEKLASCEIRLSIDWVHETLSHPTDGLVHILVHESIHARSPMLVNASAEHEYTWFRGYEEGFTEALARLVTIKHAKMQVGQRAYDTPVIKYGLLAQRLGVEPEVLYRLIFSVPPGDVRKRLPGIVADLYTQQRGKALSVEALDKLCRGMDHMFGTLSMREEIDIGEIVSVWASLLP